MDRREEALQAIQEAVELLWQLGKDYPVVHNGHLADSLDKLSNCLSDLDHREDALAAIQEAVEFHSGAGK
jgi:predicted RNase H-like HicB family nuclease